MEQFQVIETPKYKSILVSAIGNISYLEIHDEGGCHPIYGVEVIHDLFPLFLSFNFLLDLGINQKQSLHFKIF